MKILTAGEIREADAYTIRHEPIRSIDLMERAAKACTTWIRNSPLFRHPKKKAILFCGPGNNGGDGLAIARMLAKLKCRTEVCLVISSGKTSTDFNANLKRLKAIRSVKIHQIKEQIPFAWFEPEEGCFIIDALFGSGLNKPVEGPAAEAIRIVNASGLPVIAVDIPSGLPADGNPVQKGDAVIRATHTLTFQTPKLAFLLPENAPFTGDFSVLDIGLDEEFIATRSSKNHFLTMKDIRPMLRSRNKFAHKGTCGHALIVSGSYGKVGAGVLSSRACIATGAGLVTAVIPRCGYNILQSANPEVMVEDGGAEDFIASVPSPGRFDAIGIGPGIGTSEETRQALKLLIQDVKQPMVLDADALNILSENPTWLSFLPQGSVLTPHPGEFRRLCGSTDNALERLKVQKAFSLKYGVYLVLKGAHTCITTPEGEAWFNSTGNPGMATAGCGDVLTGIITSLLAQGYAPKQAALLGVYLHGLAGDIAAGHLSEESLIARNLIEFLGAAFTFIREKK